MEAELVWLRRQVQQAHAAGMAVVPGGQRGGGATAVAFAEDLAQLGGARAGARLPGGQAGDMQPQQPQQPQALTPRGNTLSTGGQLGWLDLSPVLEEVDAPLVLPGGRLVEREAVARAMVRLRMGPGQHGGTQLCVQLCLVHVSVCTGECTGFSLAPHLPACALYFVGCVSQGPHSLLPYLEESQKISCLAHHKRRPHLLHDLLGN
jgi:hypothetical protein